MSLDARLKQLIFRTSTVVTRGLSPLPPTIRERQNQGFRRFDDSP